MPISDTKATVLEIVNEVQRKLFLSTTASADSTRHSTALVDYLNDVLDEVSDSGDWVQLRGSVNVTAVSGQSTYTLPVSGSTVSIHHIHEMRVSGRVPALDPFSDISEFRRMDSLRSTGAAVRFAVVGEDVSGNPTVGIWPKPGSDQDGQTMTVHFYYKPRKMVAGTDDNEYVPLPARLMVQGLLAKAILDENGGAPTPQYQMVYAEYERMKKQAINRFNADTGHEIQFTPGWR